MRLFITTALGLLFLGFIAGAQISSSLKSNPSTFNDEVLLQMYQAHDDEYFGDQLPRNISVRWVNIPKDKDGHFIMGQTLTLAGENNFEIQIDTKTNVTTSTAFATLLHEECHVYKHVAKITEADDHGPAFQACMFNLAAEGAFKGVW